MGLRLFLPARRLLAWARLSRREESWKTAEILLLRHELTVLQRQVATRPRPTWADRALVALLLEVIPKPHRAHLRLLVTPEMVLRWHGDIVRRHWAHKSRRHRPGRPATHRNVAGLVLRMTRENPRWGYRRVHGELAGLGIAVAPSTVWEILTRAGIPPAPLRTGPTWTQFLRGQAEAILATDFLTVDLLDGTHAYVLAVIEHATRRIRILGVTAHPNQAWVTQIARNLLTDLDEHSASVRFLLRDRDTKFTTAFDAVFTAAGIEVLRSPVRAPRANAIMERWIGSCRRELTDRTLRWNQRHLPQVLREYEVHYNAHRPPAHSGRQLRSSRYPPPSRTSPRCGCAAPSGPAVLSPNTPSPSDLSQLRGRGPLGSNPTNGKHPRGKSHRRHDGAATGVGLPSLP